MIMAAGLTVSETDTSPKVSGHYEMDYNSLKRA